MPQRTKEPTVEFAKPLFEILSHLEKKRRFRQPICIAVIDAQHNYIVYRRIPESQGVLQEAPRKDVMTLALPAHLLFVDNAGQSMKATITESGEWICG
jgi:hypothetical protein